MLPEGFRNPAQKGYDKRTNIYTTVTHVHLNIFTEKKYYNDIRVRPCSILYKVVVHRPPCSELADIVPPEEDHVMETDDPKYSAVLAPEKTSSASS